MTWSCRNFLPGSHNLDYSKLRNTENTNMIDNNVSSHKPLKISGGTPVQTERGGRSDAQNKTRFDPVSSKNPGHDGCNLSEEDVKAKAAEPVEAAQETQASQQSEGTQKVSSGNCPGGNVIEQILQDLLAALQDIKIGR